MKKQFVISIVTIFILLTAIFYSLRFFAPQFGFLPLEAGNVIMAVLSALTYFLINGQLEGCSQAFIRGVYSATFLKLMVCMISLLVYVVLNRATLYKPVIFVLFGVYAIYTTVETLLLSKLVRDKQ